MWSDIRSDYIATSSSINSMTRTGTCYLSTPNLSLPKRSQNQRRRKRLFRLKSGVLKAFLQMSMKSSNLTSSHQATQQIKTLEVILPQRRSWSCRDRWKNSSHQQRLFKKLLPTRRKTSKINPQQTTVRKILKISWFNKKAWVRKEPRLISRPW